MMDVIVTIGGIALGLLALAAIPYFLVERRWRWRWREVATGEMDAFADGGGAYRAGGTVPVFLERAPATVRAAAFTSLLFGQMFVPGLLLGAIGLLAGGVGLVSIPGLITAAKLYRAGINLLKRQPREAYFGARNAAVWALWLNTIVFACSILIAVTPLHPRGDEGWMLMAFVDGYGLLSILQALLVLRATDRWEDALFAPVERSLVLR
jgi:hypothetical protein